MTRKIGFSFVFFVGGLSALPQNPQIQSGRADLFYQQNVLEVKAEDRAILEWDSFSVEANEVLRFIQPEACSSVLNRVMGSMGSELLGRVEANGQVFLLNPNGILIGKDAQIDVGSFVASTLDVANEQFLAFGEISFKGPSLEKILNRGAIAARDGIVLRAAAVENLGSLQGARVELGGEVSGDIFAVKNEGRIEADWFAAEAPGSAILMGGRVSAPEVLISGGFIRFGEEAVVDASGVLGGGKIEVFGSQIFVPQSASLKADALESGNGGEIVLKADEWNAFYGTLYASGVEDGGFAEISGKATIDYRGLAFLAASNGRKGTLLLDPTDIVIGVGGGAPGACGACALGSCGAIPANCSTFTNGNLDSAMLQAQLQGGACDVIVDATGAGAGTGTITHNAGADVVWTSSNSLAYNAVGNISIFSNILNNTGAGNISISTQGGTVQISSYTNTQNASVGSQNGRTEVCAPNADLILESAGTAANRHSQIGFFVPVGGNVTCAGPISVSCRNLTMRVSDQSNTACQIGHGQAGALGGALALFTQATCTINVAASGNISLLNSFFPLGAGNQTAARIGHGAQILGGPSILRGDITVVAGGQIDQFASTPRAVSVTCANIGHGETNSGGGGYSVVGNIFVQSGGDYNIAYVAPYSAAFTTLGVGSNGNFFSGPGITGNITIIAGRDFNLSGPTAGNAFNRAIVGWFGPGSSVPINSLIRVSACRDINLNVGNVQADFYFIGASTSGNQFGANSGVEVAAGRNLNLISSSPFAADGRGRIGSPATSGTSRTWVTAGGDIAISGLRSVGIQGVGDISVSAGGNLSLTAQGTAAADFVYIGPNNGNTAVTTRVYAQGSITATNSAASRAIIGRAVGTATYASSLDVRAGGNIQLASPYTLTAAFALVQTTGSIFVEADTQLAAGSLWTAAGGQVASVAGQALIQPVTISGACGGSLLSANSAAIAPNLLGGLSFNTGAFGGPVTLQNTNQGVTLHSAPNLVNGAVTPDLIIGPGNSQLQVVTSGDIDLTGTVCADGFQNIVINAAANPWTTGGSISARAANEIQVNTPVVVSGAGETISLVADCDFTGGNLVLNASVQTNNGNIFLNAGANPNCANTFFCSGTISNAIASSVIQNGGTVSCGSGACVIQAAQDILLNGAATSISATSGAILTRAGRDTVLTRIVTNSAPSGIIEMISGETMTMQSGAISSPNPVILVVDDDFPAAPLIGTGSFEMDAASSITGSTIRIYSARQSLNSIAGVLNSTGFTPGPLYQDTDSEQWSTYFSCTDPFLNVGFPFTVFYKDSFQETIQQAMVIVDEFLVDLHPYREFPGWMMRFFLIHKDEPGQELPYYLRRRHLNTINHPKSWTAHFY